MEGQRVQAIGTLSKCMDTEFIRSEKEQPSITTVKGEILEVPVIDLLGGKIEDDSSGVVEAVAVAANECGIFQIVNHGISWEVISHLQKVGKEFFQLEQEEKELIAMPVDSKVMEGYYGTKFHKEVESWVDHLLHRVWPPSAINFHFWPKNPPSYREANEVYVDKLRVLIDKLLKWLGLGLGLEAHEMKEAIGGDETIYRMKINYYPPCPSPDLTLGVVAHTDMSALTILVPNDSGLQVFKNGQWYDVKYIPNALIVHIGDQVEVMSNGKYKAVLHRSTVNKDTTRMSWPVFIEPHDEQKVGPISKLVGDNNPPKYKMKKYKNYVYCKINNIPQ